MENWFHSVETSQIPKIHGFTFVNYNKINATGKDNMKFGNLNKSSKVIFISLGANGTRMASKCTVTKAFTRVKSSELACSLNSSSFDRTRTI